MLSIHPSIHGSILDEKRPTHFLHFIYNNMPVDFQKFFFLYINLMLRFLTVEIKPIVQIQEEIKMKLFPKTLLHSSSRPQKIRLGHHLPPTHLLFIFGPWSPSFVLSCRNRYILHSFAFYNNNLATDYNTNMPKGKGKTKHCRW